ncbi:nucleotidyl transferase AbiEii/AbiGii toxin family protein [Fischerella sp. JS2]|uniref:nucleotidyl transferase AbiEii/AbiGii toxin family protein n=1 Tax=Fischerella sp. JS2 TaxID=2597771 RepID=UPI0028E27367|nr:nucleotidyl transferase AbiEii/AbiGii toxin family protein [Fischerella sp. JS2]
MPNIKEYLLNLATATGRPSEEVLTYHLLEGVLRRVSHSIYAQDLVLRGGMLTRIWVPSGRRIAVDVDFLGLYPFDIENTQQKFQDILAAKNLADGVVFHLESLQTRGIWLNTEFPGVRVNIDAAVVDYQQNIQIDVGFGDPLVPPAMWIDYPTLLPEKAVRLQAVRPETMVGWKLHGLVEQGAKRWRPKDLYDLMLLSTQVVLNEASLGEAIAIAFSSRNTPLQEVVEILAAPQWWNNSKNRSKWKWYTRKVPTQIMPEDFLVVVDVAIGRWKSVVEITTVE